MRNPDDTKKYYIDPLDFHLVSDYGDYLFLAKDTIEIHFFLLKTLNPLDNYGQVYVKTTAIKYY